MSKVSSSHKINKCRVQKWQDCSWYFLHFLISINRQECMLTVFLLTYKTSNAVPITIFWGYEKEKTVEAHVLNFRCSLTISYPSSLFTEPQHLVIILFLCHDPIVFFGFFFLIEGKNSIFWSIFLKEIVCLSLHLKMLQKVYSIHLQPFQSSSNITSND